MTRALVLGSILALAPFESVALTVSFVALAIAMVALLRGNETRAAQRRLEAGQTSRAEALTQQLENRVGGD